MLSTRFMTGNKDTREKIFKRDWSRKQESQERNDIQERLEENFPSPAGSAEQLRCSLADET